MVRLHGIYVRHATYQEMGIEVDILTGDSEAVANELGIDRYFAQVLPEDKDQKITNPKSKGKKLPWLVMA